MANVLYVEVIKKVIVKTQDNKIVTVVNRCYFNDDKPGLNHSTFITYFDSNYFKEYDLIKSFSGQICSVISVQQVHGMYQYTLLLKTDDASEYQHLEGLTIGTEWTFADVTPKIKPTTKGGLVEQDEPNLYDHLIE